MANGGPATAVVAVPPSPTASVPTAEDAERWSERIKAQLSRLAAMLATADSPAEEWATLFTDGVTMVETTGWKETSLYAGGPVTVVELSAPDASAPGPPPEKPAGECHRQLQEILCLNDGPESPYVSFKLFGLEQVGEILKTRQRLTARGSRAGHEARSLAVVEATWVVEAGQDTPRLASLAFPKVVRGKLTSGPAARFEDIAGSVLGGSASWREQLRIGMNAWVRRIDRSLKPDFLGYQGLAIGDVNGDGREDLYLCQPGGLPNLLYLQQADGTLADVSSASGVDWLDNTTGALLVDLDNDGDKDLALATHRAFLVMENDGKGAFTLRTQLPEIGLGYSPSAADIDLDGDLDLLVLRYGADGRAVGDFPTPHPFYDARNGGANVLLENQGGFQFADATAARGLGVENFRFSFAASWEDYDNDGDADVFIANDFGPKQLFRNEGGRFTEVAAESGAQDWGFGMSATWGDYDRDGLMDVYASNMFSGAGNQIVPQADFNPSMSGETRAKYLKMVRGNSLLRNQGRGRFADVTDPMAEGFGKWAWGAKFADLNNDGWEDLYVANGYLSQPDKDDL